jgi:hypothetical protein
MSDYIALGPTPADEPCAQVGEELYAQKGRSDSIGEIFYARL